jgi:class 3 adenylate cyclase
MLLTISSCSVGITAYLGYTSGESNLKARVFNQLTSLRASKADRIESYFKTIHNHIETLSENPSTIDAILNFTNAYRELDDLTIPNNFQEKIKSYYNKEFLGRLAKTENGSPVLDYFLPINSAANYLQYHYISENHNPVGKKHYLNSVRDNTRYSQLHAKYHPIFRKIIEKFGYYDLFLIDDRGTIVYTVYKETDFTTNLITGPYRDSNLAVLVAAIRRTNAKNYAQPIDFEAYIPSYGAPAAFIAAPVFVQNKLIGVLAVQLPVDEINNIMTGNRNWQQDGLGKSGETYLVGRDYLMRSLSRFLIEDRQGYLQTLRSLGTSETIIQRIDRYNTSILEQEVRTEAVKEAINGKKGIKILRDYRNIEVLSSYTPLKIEGLEWVILSEIDLSEAYAPIYDFERKVLIYATLLLLLTTLLAMVLADAFVKPIHNLILNARRIQSGTLDEIVHFNREDEFGQLASSFNDMVQSLKAQTNLVAEKNRENEQLLLSIFPAAIAKRLKQGEKNIAEQVSNVTVLFSDLTGFSELSASLTAYEIVTILNDLVTAFDEAAEKFGMEKIKTIGDSYMAVCGLSVPYLDRDKRALDLGMEMLAIVRRFDYNRQLQLNIRIAINSGDVVAGIVGRNKFIYDVWGDTINIANNLRTMCLPGNILVTDKVYQRLKDFYEFELLSEIIATNGKTPSKVYQLFLKIPS